VSAPGCRHKSTRIAYHQIQVLRTSIVSRSMPIGNAAVLVHRGACLGMTGNSESSATEELEASSGTFILRTVVLPH
jgi:hypothetical protein